MISMHERRGKASPARREKCRRRTEFVWRLSSGGAWGPEVVESGSSSRRRCFMILSNDHRCTGESETNRGMVATCVSSRPPDRKTQPLPRCLVWQLCASFRRVRVRGKSKSEGLIREAAGGEKKTGGGRGAENREEFALSGAEGGGEKS